MKYFLLLLISLKVLSQNPSLKIEIDSINTVDSITHRKFTINYTIKNLSNDKISFFLNPERVLPGSSGSMSTYISAVLFQENEELPTNDILTFTSHKKEALIPNFESIKDEKEKNKAIKTYMNETLGYEFEQENNEMMKSNDPVLYYRKKTGERLLKSLITLAPKEIKNYSKTFYWDKKRYYRIKDMQYYIDEKSNCYIELYFVVLREEYKEKILEEDYEKLIKIPNFTKGWFTCKRVEINFKE